MDTRAKQAAIKEADGAAGAQDFTPKADFVANAPSADAPDKDTSDEPNVGTDASGSPTAKKKRKPKKKAKKLVAPPSVVAAEPRLPWALATTQRMGRHAVAKRDISAGELVLLEAPVATVVRSQYVRDVCHVCFRDVAPSPQQQAQQPCPYKRYCSRGCAEADVHAGVTQILHQLVAQENTKVDPILLHILLELDCSRSGISFPPMKAQLHPQHGWLPVVDVAAARSEQQKRNSTSEEAATPLQSQEQQQQEEKDAQAAAAAAKSDDDRGGADAGPEEAAPEEHRGPSADAGAAGEPASSAEQEEGSLLEPAPANGHGGQSSADQQEQQDVSGSSGGGGPRSEPEQATAGLGIITCTLEDVATLTSHWDRLPDSWRSSVRQACEVLRQAILGSGLYAPGPLQQFLDLAAVVNSNSHGAGAANSANTDRAIGLYPAVSMLNHACRPNCVFASAGRCMQVRAVRLISAGEALTVAYVGVMEPRQVRSRELLESKHFVCACERCTEALAESVDLCLEAQHCKADGCKGGWLLEQRADSLSEGATWACTACGASVPSRALDGASGPQDRVDALKKAWNQAAATLQVKGHAAARPMFEAVLTQADGVLHPMHVTVVDTLMPLVNCCRAAGNMPGAIKYLTQLLAAMEAVCGYPTVEVGNLNDLLGNLCAERAASAPAGLQARAKKQAREARLRALAAYGTCLGETHENYKDLSRRLRLTR